MLLAIFLGCCPMAHATIVLLKSGKSVDVQITERGEDYIKADFFGVPMQYYFDEIETIDGEKVGASSVQEQPASEGVPPPAVEGGQPVEAQGGPADHADEYARQLLKFMPFVLVQKGVTDDEVAAAAEEFLGFARNYPASKFVKDVRCLVEVAAFSKALDRADREKSWQLISAVEKIASEYPGAMFDEFTRSKLSGLGKAAAVIHAPIECLAIYMRSYWGQVFKQWQVTIDSLLLFKEKLGFMEGLPPSLMEDVYERLITAYQSMKDISSATALLNEAQSRGLSADFINAMRGVIQQ
ncbi:MAG: hypothetical protein HQL17_04620 [Candidatus Omnitrophica bacterium]|nr:hypothetical protein [Candidatus Omnitrophota bacterium]